MKLIRAVASKDFDILVAIKIHCFNHMKEKWAPSERCCTSLTPFRENPETPANFVSKNCYSRVNVQRFTENKFDDRQYGGIGICIDFVT